MISTIAVRPWPSTAGQFVRVQQGDLPLDLPAVHQPLDPEQAGGGRHVDQLGQGLVAEGGVLLQMLQQAQVGSVVRPEIFITH